MHPDVPAGGCPIAFAQPVGEDARDRAGFPPMGMMDAAQQPDTARKIVDSFM
jgi:hypothetical protein